VSTLAGFAGVALVSAVGTAMSRAYALRRRLVDEPGDRRAHSVATPRGGGAGPVIAILAWLVIDGGLAASETWRVAFALGIVALVGWWDDHASLPASRRLLVHVVAGLAVAGALADPRVHPGVFLGVVALVTVLVNVWNFMDGINGLAASQVAIVAGAFALLPTPHRSASIAVALAALAFLPFNFPKARVFLGDVGSGALGLAVAWLGAATAIDMEFGPTVLLLGLPLSAFMVDAGLTLSRRILRGERWWEPHSQHLYQGLARRFGHVPAMLAYATWTMLAALAMVALGDAAWPFIMASLTVCYTGAALLWFVVQYRLAAGGAASEMTDP
jgi:UDP-N-acetylmuramyl pentapeptide phosphotransferase/UDP-N-acetylglucosamine-1-phosphate transferase